ncbi:MAG: hypothetical protein IPL46_28360 [Saprospiraceae bacterium]|nr:hypothetical protein [Saprospiraceae bacterium]
MDNQINYLALCRHQIESKLQWADSDHWRHQEFLLLSDKIFAKSGVSLSVNTLKRLWGKLIYEHSPNAATLNALANFLDCENWMEFIAKQENSTKPTGVTIPPINNRTNPPQLSRNGYVKPLLQWTTVSTTIILIIFILYRSSKNSASTFQIDTPERVSFSSSKVVHGVPNTVIFAYDVQAIRADQFSIQQSWDDSRRFSIDPLKKEATSIYYYPGYWRAKLLVDTVILKEHDLLVESDGWTMTLDHEPIPRYFLPEELLGGEILGVKETIYDEAIQGLSQLPWLTAHFIADFQELPMDNLQVEIRLKNDYRAGLTTCRNVQIMLVGSEGFFSIPMSMPGCVGDLRLRFSDVVKEGRDHNLSAFGRDLDQWQQLKIQVIDRQVSLHVGEDLVDSFKYQASAGIFYGVRIKFKGAGQIKSICVKDSSDEMRVYDLVKN